MMKRSHFWMLYFLLVLVLIAALTMCARGVYAKPEVRLPVETIPQMPHPTENSCGTSGTSCGTTCTTTEKVESDCEFPPALPHPTVGEVDAEAEENYWIEQALLRRAHRIDNCKITHYCCEPYAHVCGTGDGLTAMGGRVLPGVSCAVPKEIPLGSTIMIDWGDGELEYRRADDRGGGVKGDHIDLAVPTHRGALELGVKYATVYWCEEE